MKSKLLLLLLVFVLVTPALAGMQALPSIQMPLNTATGDGSFQTIGSDVQQRSGNFIDNFLNDMLGVDQPIDLIAPEQAVINNTVATVGNGYQEYSVGDYSINITTIIDGSQFQATDKDKSNGPNKVSMISDSEQFDYKVTDGQFKENITLTSPHDISFEYTLSDGQLEKNANGTIWVKTLTGPVIQIERPYVVDNTGKRVDLDYNINNNKLELIGDISQLQYPVVIDPTFTVLPNLIGGGSVTDTLFTFSKDNSYMFIATGGGSSSPYNYVFKYDLTNSSNWTKISSLTAPSAFPQSIDTSNDGYLAIGSGNAPVMRIYTKNLSDPSNWSSIGTLNDLSAVYGLSFSNNGNYLAATSYSTGSTLKIYTKNLSDTVNWTALTAPSQPGNYVYENVFSPTSTYLVTGAAASPYILIYKYNSSSTANYTLITNLSAQAGTIRYPTFSYDESYLAFINGTSGSPSIYIKNLSNPSNFTFVGVLSGYAGTPQVLKFANSTNYLALGTNGNPNLTIYTKNLSDPSNWSIYTNLTTVSASQIRDIRWTSNDTMLGAVLNKSPGVLIYNITPTPPVASFTTNVNSGGSPLVVLFNDTSTNSPTGWLWQWGDGTANDTFQNGTHTFSSIGNYTVNLTATNGDGSNLSASTTISVLSSPVASFTKNVTNGIMPLSVQFNDTSTNATAWNWSFGDGTYNTTQNATHTYTGWIGNTTTIYNVSLNATNTAGYNISANQTITAYPLLSNITSNVTSGTSPFDVLFNNTITNGTATTFLWNWSDGGTNVTTQNATHHYSTVGTFSILSNISNAYSYNWTNKLNYITSINQTWPTVAFSTNVSYGYPKYDVQFTDATTNGTTYYWDFGDGNTSTTQSPVHSYASWIGNLSASYTVKHSSTNANGTTWLNVTNNQTSYPLTEVFSSNVSSGMAPLSVQFNTTYGNGTATNWSWDFGDSNTSTVRNATHTYYSIGSYDVILNSSNSYSYVWSKNSSMINATPPPPVAGFSAVPLSGATPLTVQFTDTSTFSPTSWYWIFGDGNTSTAQSPSHTYYSTGFVSVEMRATNAYGSDWENKTNYISISATLPTGNNYWFPHNIYSGIHMVNATSTGVAAGSMSGNVTSPTNDNTTWFTIGTSSGSYSLYTTLLTPDVVGNYSFNQTGLPLMPGVTYYVRAACANGTSLEEYSFTTGALPAGAITQTSYGQYFNKVQNDMHDPQTALSDLMLPIADTFGGGGYGSGGSFGMAVVFTIIFGVALLILWLRQENLVITAMVAVLGSTVILYTIQADLVWIIFAAVAVIFATAGVRIFRGLNAT